jgi:RHS repeat-associated protein
MSNKSGIAEQIISLPKNGDKGLGEKFQPDLHTGTGNFSIPIVVPSGRNGFQPQLNLTYSTGFGNGPFGKGWNLSNPNVSLKAAKGIPKYQGKDTFILSGAEDLVLIKTESANGKSKQYYRPRTEGLFAQIIHLKDGDTNQWEVTNKDGIKSVYGKTESSRVYDHDCPGHIFQWLLSETEDLFGNRIIYTYKPEDKHDLDKKRFEENHHYNQVYLTKIEYLNYSPDDITEKYLFSVEFDYGEYPESDNELMANPSPLNPWLYRPDPFSSYRAGFEIRSVRRCRRILTKVHEVDGPSSGQLIKAYRLKYLDEIPGTERRENELPLNNVSLLANVTLTGYKNTAETESLPPLEFQYTKFAPENKKYEIFTAQGDYLPEKALNTPDYELIDLHGYGLPDVIQTSAEGFRYWRNLGNCRFDFPRLMHKAPAGVTLADPSVQFADMEGNGSADLLITNGLTAGYFPNSFAAQWGSASFCKYRQAPSFNLRDPDVRLMDMDGDGVIDALYTGVSHFMVYYNRGREGWDSQAQRIARQNLAEFPDVCFSAPDQRLRLAAMNGDGLQDIVLIHNRRVEYWPNLGYGNWGRRITMQNSPSLPLNYNPRRLILADIDGDGYADLVYVDFGQVHYWINQSGNAWSEEHVIKGTPPVSDLDAVRVADMKGTGTAGILWTYDYSLQNRTNYKYLDLTGGIKPYLLNEMDNNIGAVTRVTYSSSAKFALADREKGIPWQTHLPFPVQVVEKVEVIDRFSHAKLVTRYAYHHGHWDGVEREKHGFGMVEQFDTEMFEDYYDPALHEDSTSLQQHFSPPTLTKTWFHLGPVGDESGAWSEADYSKEYWPGDRPVLSRPQIVADFLNSLPRRVKRDAVRTLKGSILRTELYALDNTEFQDRPFTVTEHLCGIREAEPPNPGDPERPRVFFPFALIQRSTQWERGDDPLTKYSFSDAYDHYGQPGKLTTVALPRRIAKRQLTEGGKQLNEAKILATHTWTEFAMPDSGLYIHDRVAQTRVFELVNPPGVNEKDPGNLQSLLEDQNKAAQAIHRQFCDLLDNWRAGQELPGELRLVGHTVNHYDGDAAQAFSGLPAGKLGLYGALTRSEALVFTENELIAAYGNERPHYLGGIRNLPPEAPAGFGSDHGYQQKQRSTDGYHDGYYLDSKSQKFDFQESGSPGASVKELGIVVAVQDPLGHITSIIPEKYRFLPQEVIDPVGLTTTAQYDYCTLQPKEITDPNGNRTVFTFTPLGLLETVSIQGKNKEGDQQRPSVKMVYNFQACVSSGLPVNVRTIRRQHHDSETDIPLSERDKTIETIEYSDGFGRLLQTRTQGEDIRFGDAVFGGGILPSEQTDQDKTKKDIVGQTNSDTANSNVIISGRQTYDNKGRVVEKYEPFFSVGWDYEALPPKGQKIRFYYDSLGRLIRTVNPDASEQSVVHGIPYKLSDPCRFAPSPWEVYTYDVNDNAGRTPAADPKAAEYEHHWNTPGSIIADALGRTIAAIERNRTKQKPGEQLKKIEEYITCSTYDIQGSLLTVTDALDRMAFRHWYDLTGRTLCNESIDAGTRKIVLDAAGNPIEQWDSKGASVLRTYDILNRPRQLWARDNQESSLTLREQLEYGDGSELTQSEEERTANRELNLLGRLFKHYDEAGLLTINKYDFKGNILEKSRQVISDEQILGALNTNVPGREVSVYCVDWKPSPGVSRDEHLSALLCPVAYDTSVTYDALNRIKTLQYPEDVGDSQSPPARKVLYPQYNRAGALESVKLGGQVYVGQIAYNAKGQRVFISYGNSVMTRYAYHPRTFRLVRMRTERYESPLPAELTYRPTGLPLQDFAYGYDPAGNILAIHDRTPECGIGKADALDRQFIYDAIYQLASATGREEALEPPPKPWDYRYHSTDPTLTRGYTQTYSYDPAGNLINLNHAAGAVFNRQVTPQADNNRLGAVKSGSDTYSYTYDQNGNLSGENTERHFGWDHSDRLAGFSCKCAGSDRASLQAQYLYDAGGQRVKKLVKKQGGEYIATVYIDGLFEYHRLVISGQAKENNTLHIMDNQSRIALLRIGDAFPDDRAPEIAVKYQLGDHLGSSNVVIGGADSSANDFINREEYYPYGETSFGSFAHKRYRFTGKELDEESGLYYHGARYYLPWLARWASCDPIGLRGGINLYHYVFGNPMALIDPNGEQAVSIRPVPIRPPVVPRPPLSIVRSPGPVNSQSALPQRGTGVNVRIGQPTTKLPGGETGTWVIPLSDDVGTTGPWKVPTVYEQTTSNINRRKIERRLDQMVHLMWQNGIISEEQRDYYMKTGSLPGITEPTKENERNFFDEILRAKLGQLMSRLPENIRRSLEGWKTLAIGLFVDSSDRFTFIYTISSNDSYTIVEEEAKKLGIEMYKPTPRAGTRGDDGAPKDAEQLLMEIEEQNYGELKLRAVITTRDYCDDCRAALRDKNVHMVPFQKTQ